MKPSEDLFDLIHSLTPQERRHFLRRSLGLNPKQAPNYVRLFTALSGMESYDEAKVRQVFAGEPCLRQFTRVKNYLYEQLMGSLQEIHARDHLEGKVRADLNAVQLLSQKGLFGQAQKRLDRVVRTAEQYELVVFYAEISRWKRWLAKRLVTNKTKLERRLEILDQEELLAMEELKDEIQAFSRHDQMWSRLNQSLGDGKDIVILPVATPKTFNAKLAHLLTHAMGLRQQGKREAAHQVYLAILDHWLSAPHQMGLYPARFSKAVTVFLYSAHSIGDYTGFSNWLTVVAESSTLPAELKASTWIASSNLRLLRCLNLGEIQQAHQIAVDLEPWLESSKTPVSTWLPATLNFILYHFLYGNAATARKWCQRILQLPAKSERRDLSVLARMVYLLILFEAGDHEILPYFVKSWQRYIRHTRSMTGLEEALSHFFSKVVRVPEGEEQQALLGLLAKKIDGIAMPSTGIEEVKGWLARMLTRP